MGGDLHVVGRVIPVRPAVFHAIGGVLPVRLAFVGDVVLLFLRSPIPKQSKIENWDFRLRFRSLIRSASLLREYATPTLTPTSRENL